ncbi:tRNA (guanosine(37)-N1)-methyltransferase TrmD [Polyangium jinanense]|uniref:tRNA (guanine-N(1)-)-methyltransferase n=1 Tax=Polyangium jinanense TaxID=2829994 RepID=A0A9X4ASQ5_9BACT|nr:tRNA (guanosine(37)-N1)-methyltransferase TrmD [Polyangium jinanense]MDC3958291.1 tRNA (guanosine(37)-N1)-methyltransferase TrmD [Polyangium jinanense]MDC3983374.1 tRNA (guanosine(37)-N1)-methyltransferase TrmD [Polyangium jinanense]
MRVDIVTLFPEMFEPFLSTGMVGRAARAGALDVRCANLREHGLGRHRSVDDTPYGGGSGMVIRVDVVVECIEALEQKAREGREGADATRSHRVLLSPQGSVLDQRKVEALAALPWITLVCGRYEGFDDRVHAFVDEEISLGDFVLAGGEVAAMAIVDACSRLLPGVLGSADSAMHESHSTTMDGLLEYPHYTRPEEFRGMKVPEVLKGGNHAAIAAFRREQAEARTAARRPDLLERAKRLRAERSSS